VARKYQEVIEMVREYTNRLLEGIDEGIYNKDQVINAFCKYMSEDDVQDMMECNEMVEVDEDESGI